MYGGCVLSPHGLLRILQHEAARSSYTLPERNASPSHDTSP